MAGLGQKRRGCGAVSSRLAAGEKGGGITKKGGPQGVRLSRRSGATESQRTPSRRTWAGVKYASEARKAKSGGVSLSIFNSNILPAVMS